MKLVAIVFVMALAVLIANPAVSQQVIELKPPSEETLAGLIKMIDTNGNLVVSVQTAPDTSQDLSIILNNETTITLDGKVAKASDLRPGHTVTVKCTVEKTVAIVNNVPTREVLLRTAKSVSADEDVARAIDCVVSTYLAGQLGNSASLRNHKLAPRLQEALKPFGQLSGLLSNRVWIGMGADSVSMSSDEEDWIPIICSAVGGKMALPKIEMGKGEMGLRRISSQYVDTYIKEGSRVRIAGRVFVFRKGWTEEKKP